MALMPIIREMDAGEGRQDLEYLEELPGTTGREWRKLRKLVAEWVAAHPDAVGYVTSPWTDHCGWHFYKVDRGTFESSLASECLPRTFAEQDARREARKRSKHPKCPYCECE